MNRRLVVSLAWTLSTLTLLGLAATLWLDRLLGQTGYPELAYLWDTGNLPLLVARPGSLPAADYLAGLADASLFAYLSCLGFVLLLTPTGSLPSPRWRWWARVAAAGLALAFLTSVMSPHPLYPEYPDIGNPLGVAALESGPLALLFPVGALTILIALLVGAVSLLLRFRRARGVERQQLRWVAWGAALAALALLMAIVVLALDGDTALLQVALGACLALLPLATGAAILRHRLYDLDYLISRAVVYGLLTVAGVGVYVAVVKLAEWPLREGVGWGGSLVATAVIAVGFAPARDRLQRWVDRRLYGDRHDPVQAMARLGERLRDAPSGTPDGDALAGVLHGVCETLRLPWASLRVEDGAEVASFGRPATATESIPWSMRASASGHCWSGCAQVRTPSGWLTGRSLGSWPPRWRWPCTQYCCPRSCSAPGSGWSPPARRNAAGCAVTSTTDSARS